MDNSLFCALDSLKSLFDDVFSGLGQYLDGHVVRNQVLLDQSTAELVLGLGSGRKTDLDLLEADLNH